MTTTTPKTPHRTHQAERLRVALIVGTLSQGGAEKQLVYMAQALQQSGVEVRVYCLTLGEFYETSLRAIGLQPIWIGQYGNPLLRLIRLNMALLSYRPHIIQSTHFYTNLYTALSGYLRRVIALGAVRNDAYSEVKANGRWGHWLLHLPPALLANSYQAQDNIGKLGVKAKRVNVLSNVIDLAAFDQRITEGREPNINPTPPTAIAVARLVPQKRLERFIAALAIARHRGAALRGVIVGDGPERPRLEALAQSLGLVPDGVSFLGLRDDIPALLRQSAMLVLCSDHEGFPNVLIEAMAAHLPVITTPAGDASTIIHEGVNGYVVSFNDIETMAEHMVRLAHAPALRDHLGKVGRQSVEQRYSSTGLGRSLLAVYSSIAKQQGKLRILEMLSTEC